MEGRTSIVIAHRLSTVRALDRILVFDRGRVARGGQSHRPDAARGHLPRPVHPPRRRGCWRCDADNDIAG